MSAELVVVVLLHLNALAGPTPETAEMKQIQIARMVHGMPTQNMEHCLAMELAFEDGLAAHFEGAMLTYWGRLLNTAEIEPTTEVYCRELPDNKEEAT